MRSLKGLGLPGTQGAFSKRCSYYVMARARYCPLPPLFLPQAGACRPRPSPEAGREAGGGAVVMDGLWQLCEASVLNGSPPGEQRSPHARRSGLGAFPSRLADAP